MSIAPFEVFYMSFFDRVSTKVRYLINGKQIKDLTINEKKKFIVDCLVDSRTVKVKKITEIKTTREDEMREEMLDENTLPVELDVIFQEFFMKSDGSMIPKEQQIDLISSSLRSIPDTILDVNSKSIFLQTYFGKFRGNFLENITDVAYDESLPALRATTRKTNKLGLGINVLEYNAATKHKIDNSSFIILTVGLLKNYGDSKIEKELSEIQRDYFELDYESAIKKILNVVNTLKSNNKNDQNLTKVCNSVINALKKCYEVKPSKNDPRRFYENKLSQYMLGEYYEGGKLQSVDKLSRALLGTPTVSPEEVEKSIASISDLPELSTMKVSGEKQFNFITKLKHSSPKYLSKDRINRPGIVARELETMGEELGDSVWSVNLGALKANSPNYPDEISIQNLRNRPVDSVQTESMGGKGYSEQNKRQRAAFISSISGHIFATIANLLFYIDSVKNKIPKNELQKDINNFLLANVGTYIKRGYHSAHELIDVLREPNIKKEFKKRGIKIDVNFEDILFDNAMNATLPYAKNLGLKETLHVELVEKIKEKIISFSEKLGKETKSDRENKIPKMAVEFYEYLSRKERSTSDEEILKLISQEKNKLITKFPEIGSELKSKTKSEQELKEKKSGELKTIHEKYGKSSDVYAIERMIDALDISKESLGQEVKDSFFKAIINYLKENKIITEQNNIVAEKIKNSLESNFYLDSSNKDRGLGGLIKTVLSDMRTIPDLKISDESIKMIEQILNDETKKNEDKLKYYSEVDRLITLTLTGTASNRPSITELSSLLSRMQQKVEENKKLKAQQIEHKLTATPYLEIKMKEEQKKEKKEEEQIDLKSRLEPKNP